MTAIEFENISKQYRLGLVSTRTLSHDINRWWQTSVLHKEDPYLKIGETNDRATKGSSEYVWALRDINFKVEQGDVVGIIGKNGAGKSTLLKLLSKVTGPTTGTIRARGRIGSLLEVGTGFHQEMTGRENIYLNGAILGMSRQEISRKLDEIVDFSGCERYIDTPVKRYSSGMMVRLGFAVAAHLDPEILVVDEVLAVGDAEFQKKAIWKMKEVSQGEGRTVLFVSHNMNSVRNLCNSGIVLLNGVVDYSGTAEECVDYYISGEESVGYNIFLKDLAEHKNSGEGIYVTNFKLQNERPKTGDSLTWEIYVQNDSCRVKDVEIAINFRGKDDLKLLEFNSKESGRNVQLRPGLNRIGISNNSFPLLEGNYKMNIWVGSNDNLVDWYIGGFILHLETGQIDGIVPKHRGYPIFLPCEWNF